MLQEMIVSCLQWWMTSFSSVHFVCFGEERNMNKCASTSWSSCLKTLWACVKHWITALHRFYVYRKPISSPRSRNLKVIKKMCTFEVHLCMMSGQPILSGKPFNTFSMARFKNIAIASDPHSPFHYHQGSYYINPCYHAWHAFFFSLTIFS